MSLAGKRIVSFESRHQDAMAQLIRRQEGEPFVAPSMEEAGLGAQTAAREKGEALLRGECDVTILLTGVGTRMWVEATATAHPEAEILAALARTTIVSRGPKPVAVLKQWNLRPAAVAPEPNTWRELLGLFPEPVSLEGKRVFVQEYGMSNEKLLAGLRAAGAAEVHRVPIYAWRMPADTAPLEEAARRIAEGEADAALFTSQQQAAHLLEVAERLGLRDAVLGAFGGAVKVASVGPITTEGLAQHGIGVDFEPEHPKMGHLVSGLSKAADRVFG